MITAFLFVYADGLVEPLYSGLGTIQCVWLKIFYSSFE